MFALSECVVEVRAGSCEKGANVEETPCSFNVLRILRYALFDSSPVGSSLSLVAMLSFRRFVFLIWRRDIPARVKG